MVHLYITVVALGLGLVTSADWDRVETRESRIRYYDPSCSSVTAKIYIAGSFDDEFPSTAKLLRHHCSNGENSWTSVSRRDDAQHVVASLESLHKFSGACEKAVQEKCARHQTWPRLRMALWSWCATVEEATPAWQTKCRLIESHATTAFTLLSELLV